MHTGIILYVTVSGKYIDNKDRYSLQYNQAHTLSKSIIKRTRFELDSSAVKVTASFATQQAIKHLLHLTSKLQSLLVSVRPRLCCKSVVNKTGVDHLAEFYGKRPCARIYSPLQVAQWSCSYGYICRSGFSST